MNNKPIADSFIQCPLPPIRKIRKRINQAVCRKFRSPHIKNRNLLSRKRFKHAIFFNRYKQPIISQHPHFCLLHIVSKQTDVSQSMIFPLTGSPHNRNIPPSLRQTETKCLTQIIRILLRFTMNEMNIAFLYLRQ